MALLLHLSHRCISPFPSLSITSRNALRMYSGKMFFSTQSDVAAGRYGGYFSHSIDAIIDGGAVAAVATSMSQINASSSSKATSATTSTAQYKNQSVSLPPTLLSSSSSSSSLSSFSSSAAAANVFLKWHSWYGMKNWSVCGQWNEGRGRIHDLRGTSLPQLAFLNKHVRFLFYLFI